MAQGTAVYWLFFNAVIPLLSIPLVLFGLWLIGKPKSLLFVIRDGQLCFFCAVTISIFFKDMYEAKSADILIICFAGLFLMLSMFTYGVAVINTEMNGAENVARIGWSSLLTSVAAVSIVVWGRSTLGIF